MNLQNLVDLSVKTSRFVCFWTIIAIRKSELHVRKASHRGSKQQ